MYSEETLEPLLHGFPSSSPDVTLENSPAAVARPWLQITRTAASNTMPMTARYVALPCHVSRTARTLRRTVLYCAVHCSAIYAAHCRPHCTALYAALPRTVGRTAPHSTHCTLHCLAMYAALPHTVCQTVKLKWRRKKWLTSWTNKKVTKLSNNRYFEYIIKWWLKYL